jgi:hypothetical protein
VLFSIGSLREAKTRHNPVPIQNLEEKRNVEED